MDVVYLSSEALQQLKDDLHHARTVERARITQEIAVARSHGDLSENAEYDAAKDAQGRLEARIAQMETTLSKARIVDESQVDTSRARILSSVNVRNLSTNSEHRFTLVSEREADIRQGKISISSPIGKGLLGTAIGDKVNIEVPSGTMKLEVVNITRDG